jgi:3-deoxy-D-manno-octulosonic acid (KDO) 8-phosphate synthase
MGADGLLVEVHPNPAEALSDGQQQVDFASFKKLASALPPFLVATKKTWLTPSRQRTSETVGEVARPRFHRI